MTNTTAKDMTTGSPMKLIIGFALPVMLGLLFQQFYNMVDTMVVGNYLGVDALAGVGSTGAINFLILGFCLGLSTGFAVPIAQKFGAKDFPALKKYFANTIYMTALVIIPLTIVVSVLCKPILVLMNTSADIIDYAYGYIFIIFLGLPIAFLYNLLSSIIRALGDSRTPLYFLIFSALLNIVLDLVAVLALGMGVEGPAIATVISQGISVVLCFFYMMKKFDILRLSKKDFAFDKQKSFHLLHIGVPMGLQFSITAIGSVLLQTAVNGISNDAVAAMSTGIKVSMFFNCPLDGLSATMATYAGQNTGAGKIDRLTKGVKCATIIGFLYSVFAFLLLLFVSDYVALLFLKPTETNIIDMVGQFLFYNSLGYVFLSLIFIFRNTIQGMGYSGLSMFAGVFELVGRCSIAFGFVPTFGFIAACVANPVSWFLADIFLIPAFFFCKKSLVKKLENLSQTN